MTENKGNSGPISLDNYLDSFSQALEERVNNVKAREEELARREKLFEETYPESGSNYDVLQLNVGGRTGIALLRRTLVQFEHTQLAAKFSGRWDDQLEQDRDGNYFIDQDPDDFCKLIAFLRERSNSAASTDPSKYPRPPEMPSRSFLRMLENYGLIPFIYPVELETLKGGPATVEESEPGRIRVHADQLVTFHLRLSANGPKLASLEAVVGQDVSVLHLGSTWNLADTKGQASTAGLNDGRGYCHANVLKSQHLVAGSRIQCKFFVGPTGPMEVKVNGDTVYSSSNPKPGSTCFPCFAVQGSIEMHSFELDC